MYKNLYFELFKTLETQKHRGRKPSYKVAKEKCLLLIECIKIFNKKVPTPFKIPIEEIRDFPKLKEVIVRKDFIREFNLIKCRKHYLKKLEMSKKMWEKNTRRLIFDILFLLKKYED